MTPGPELRAFLAWRRAGGPFGRLVFAAPFFGRLTQRPGEGRARAALAAFRHLLPDPPEDEDAVLVDLEPTLSLAAVPYLRSLSGRIVPLIARWPAEPAVLPVAPVLGLLVRYAPGPRERRSSAGPPIFLLDGARAGPAQGVSSRLLERRFDNRYQYQLDYLPPGAGLVEAGCRRVVWLSPDGAPAPDLIGYEGRLIRAGLAIDHRRASTRS